MMTTLSFFAFIFLGLSFLSFWVRRDPKIWASLFIVSLLAALISGTVQWIGLFIICGWAFLWNIYIKQQLASLRFVFFVVLVLVSYGFVFHLLPGYHPLVFSPKFILSYEKPLIGLFPLAFLVPLAKNRKDWQKVLKGFLIGCLGIAVLAILAVISGAIHFQFKLPSFSTIRFLSNFVLVAIPEEGFYRGFLQKGLCNYFHNTKKGNILALVLTSLIFTLAHIYWSPGIAISAFVFLASLLYGGVYLISGKIESAILTHFLLNFIHMTCFSYHAL